MLTSTAMDTLEPESVASFYARLVQLPPRPIQDADAARAGPSNTTLPSMPQQQPSEPATAAASAPARTRYAGFRSSGVHDMSSYRPQGQARPSSSATGDGPGPPSFTTAPPRIPPAPSSHTTAGRAPQRPRSQLAAVEALLESQWQASQAASRQTATALPRLTSDNVGYRLLQAAGWREGRGLGTQEQGRVAPVDALRNPGARGIGFTKQQGGAAGVGGGGGTGAGAGRGAGAGGRQGDGAGVSETGAQAGGGAAAAVQASKRARISQLVEQELAGETTEQKVSHHRAAARAEAEAQRGRALQRALYRAFDDPFDNVGATTANSNPLAGRNRLTATNPLLGDDEDD